MVASGLYYFIILFNLLGFYDLVCYETGCWFTFGKILFLSLRSSMFSISILFCYHSPPSGVTKHTQIATNESTKPDKFCVILSHTPIRSSPPEQETNNKIRHIAIWIPHRHGCFPPTNRPRFHGRGLCLQTSTTWSHGSSETFSEHFQNLSVPCSNKNG